MNRRISNSLIIIALGASVVVLMVVVYFVSNQDFDTETHGDPATQTPLEGEFGTSEIKKFLSEEDFREYLARSVEMAFSINEHMGMDDQVSIETVGSSELAPASAPSKRAPERYSETNIQVQGIDEPDIVKTDGSSIYSSSLGFDQGGTKVVEAFPLDNLSLLEEMEESGRLLLSEGILVIFGDEKISGYDVGDVNAIELEWEIEINDGTKVDDVRLHDGEIFMVINNRLVSDQPCVLEPLTFNGNSTEIRCTDIYHPKAVVPIDAVYTLLSVDLLTGEKEREVSFVGSSKNSIVYMSPDSLYFSYLETYDFADFMITFFVEEFDDLLPEDVIERLDRLTDQDITSETKMNEMDVILDEFSKPITIEEMKRLEEGVTTRMPAFYEKRKYELESTGIVKVRLDSFKIEALGSVPGRLLNQFALDEYEDNLRVATTVGEDFFWMFGPDVESRNEVYVLDGNLRQIGVVRELGLGEKIFSVRFLQDKGYVVTFREIDPFYILDLSDPSNPETKGELKIPGYSSYLHPVTDRYILGIGKEDWRVKVSLFDVADPFDPKEIDKYILQDESSSEVLDNHHAFLLDSRHEVFFLPGSRGGYIFSFEGGAFELIKTIEQSGIKRAIYIDDYLYVISADSIMVLDQGTWDVVRELKI